MIQFQPTDDRILIERINTSGFTAGGIFLPDSAQAKPNQGKVIAVGPGRMLDNGERLPVGVSVGDTVMLAKYTGGEIEVDGSKIELFSEKDILARLVEE